MKMGRQTIAASRLAGEIAHSRYSRKAFAFNLRKDSEALLLGFRDKRVAAAADAKAVLNDCVAGIKSDVETLMGRFQRERMQMSAESQENMGRFQRERMQMSAESQENLDLFISRLKAEVLALKQETAELMQAYAVSRRRQAKLSHDERSLFTASLSRQISALMEQFRKSRADMSDDVKADLLVFLTKLKESVRTPKSPTAKIQPSRKDDRSDAEQARVKARVVPPKKPDLSAERKQTPPVEPPAPEPIPHPSVEESWPDDLTVIRGIGQSMNARLKDAGITTFAQLAKKQPQELLDIVGVKSAKFVNVNEWIAQAADWLKK